ncbi:Uncharacterized protein AAY48_1739 [Leptospira interrogans serovar Muenchen]|nr:Uncharacterized protein AAY48_1739 [Leptospira interrogans serovar Muenchen]
MIPEEQVQKILATLIRQGNKHILLTNVTGRYVGNSGEIGKILTEYAKKEWIVTVDGTSFIVKDELLLRLCPELYFEGRSMKNYSLEERKEARLKLLNGLYDVLGGSLSSMTDIWKVNEKLNIDQDLMRITHDYLIEKNYIKSMALGGMVSLTLAGVEKIENVKQNPNTDIGDFPAYNITFINSTITNSGVQIGTSNSQQTIINADSIVLDWLKELSGKIDQLSIPVSDQSKLREEIKEVEVLLGTEETKKSKYLKIAWENIKAILQSATGSAVFELIKKMPILPS